MKKKKNSRGFTLIELLAVIIILGILMIIAIPSVTSYINNSRKSAYVDTAREIISGARNFVNEGKLEMFDTGTTYYIPVSCITTENGQKSPYGDFVEDQAFVIVTYTGKNYNYFWISRDTTGQGVKTITPVGELDEDDIKSDIEASEITPTEPAETGKNTIKVLSKDDCKTFGEGSGGENTTPSTPAVETIMAKEDFSSQVNQIPGTDIYIFKGENPTNYVKFNNEDWRIIGIYGNQLKIQRVGAPTGLKSIQWETTGTNTGWANSSLKTYLNETYYATLSETAKNMIDDNGSWNIGAVAYNATAQQAYESATATKWKGIDTSEPGVGLMATYEFLYASGGDGCQSIAGDYNYANGFNKTCGVYTNDWMNNSNSWSLSSNSDTIDYSLYIQSSGAVNTVSVDSSYCQALPAVFLKSSVKLSNESGDGSSSSNAYVLEYTGQ